MAFRHRGADLTRDSFLRGLLTGLRWTVCAAAAFFTGAGLIALVVFGIRREADFFAGLGIVGLFGIPALWTGAWGVKRQYRIALWSATALLAVAFITGIVLTPDDESAHKTALADELTAPSAAVTAAATLELPPPAETNSASVTPTLSASPTNVPLSPTAVPMSIPSTPIPPASIPPTSIPPTLIPPTTVSVPTVAPTPEPIGRRIERSIRDNKNAVKNGLSLEKLSVQFDAAASIVVLTIEPKKPRTEPGYLTNASALAVVAGKAIWGTYPEVSAIDVYVRRQGDRGPELLTFARYSKGEWTGRDFAIVSSEVARDNKYMFCRAEYHDIHFSVYGALRDRGCLERRTNSGDTVPPLRPVYAELTGVGRAFKLSKDGWDITASRVTKRPTVADQRALGVYLVVRLDLFNTSRKTQSLCGDRFELVDDRDRVYPPYDLGTQLLGDGELCSRINAGLHAPANLIFDVPPDATGLMLKSLGGLRIALGDVSSVQFGQ